MTTVAPVGPATVSDADLARALDWAEQHVAHALKRNRLRGWEVADQLRDAAVDAVLRAREVFDPARGLFVPFCRVLVRARVTRAMRQGAARAEKRPAVCGFAEHFDAPAREPILPADPADYDGFADLPDGLRTVATLYHLEGLNQAECGARLGVDQSTVSRMLVDAATVLADAGRA